MKYIFTEEQFITLLVLAGQKNIYMFRQKEELNDSAIVNAVAQMYKRKQVVRQRGKMVLSKEIMKIVSIIGSSEYLIDVIADEMDFWQQLIYPGEQDDIVVLEKEEHMGSPVIKIWHTKTCEYIQDLCDNERLPESLTANREEAKALEKTALGGMSEEYKDEDIFLKIRRVRVSDGQKDNQIEAFYSPMFQWICISQGTDSIYHIYSQKEIAGLLLSEIKGEEI